MTNPLPTDPIELLLRYGEGRCCRHCGQGQLALYARRLCRVCYYTPGIRERYPVDPKRGRAGVGGSTGSAGLPEPTEARPGTPEKLRVLMERAARGQQLWHPQDARMDADPRT